MSVVTIFRDAERFLEEAIASVFAQTHHQWELLLVDDGSTDASTAIALRCATSRPDRVRYLEHEGHQKRGLGASRQLGLLRARGHYVAPLDSDDVWLPHRLERQVALLEAHPTAALVYGNRQYWNSWSPGHGGDAVSQHGIPSDRLYAPPELLRLTYGVPKTTNPASFVMFRREAALRLGGYDDAFAGTYEDQVLLVKMYLTEAVFVANECWERYRQHPDSHVSRAVASGRIDAERQAFLRWLEAYLSRHGMKGTDVWQAAENELWRHRHPLRARLVRLAKAGARQALPGFVLDRLRARRRDHGTSSER